MGALWHAVESKTRYNLGRESRGDIQSIDHEKASGNMNQDEAFTVIKSRGWLPRLVKGRQGLLHLAAFRRRNICNVLALPYLGREELIQILTQGRPRERKLPSMKQPPAEQNAELERSSSFYTAPEEVKALAGEYGWRTSSYRRGSNRYLFVEQSVSLAPLKRLEVLTAADIVARLLSSSAPRPSASRTLPAPLEILPALRSTLEREGYSVFMRSSGAVVAYKENVQVHLGTLKQLSGMSSEATVDLLQERVKKAKRRFIERYRRQLPEERREGSPQASSSPGR